MRRVVLHHTKTQTFLALRRQCPSHKSNCLSPLIGSTVEITDSSVSSPFFREVGEVVFLGPGLVGAGIG